MTRRRKPGQQGPAFSCLAGRLPRRAEDRSEVGSLQDSIGLRFLPDLVEDPARLGEMSGGLGGRAHGLQCRSEQKVGARLERERAELFRFRERPLELLPGLGVAFACDQRLAEEDAALDR